MGFSNSPFFFVNLVTRHRAGCLYIFSRRCTIILLRLLFVKLVRSRGGCFLGGGVVSRYAWPLHVAENCLLNSFFFFRGPTSTPGSRQSALLASSLTHGSFFFHVTVKHVWSSEMPDNWKKSPPIRLRQCALSSSVSLLYVDVLLRPFAECWQFADSGFVCAIAVCCLSCMVDFFSILRNST